MRQAHLRQAHLRMIRGTLKLLLETDLITMPLKMGLDRIRIGIHELTLDFPTYFQVSTMGANRITTIVADIKVEMGDLVVTAVIMDDRKVTSGGVDVVVEKQRWSLALSLTLY